jgi:hypothetical protein
VPPYLETLGMAYIPSKEGILKVGDMRQFTQEIFPEYLLRARCFLGIKSSLTS